MKEFQGTNGKTLSGSTLSGGTARYRTIETEKLLNSDVNTMSDNSSPYGSISPFMAHLMAWNGFKNVLFG
jgi:hypothetical protein